MTRSDWEPLVKAVISALARFCLRHGIKLAGIQTELKLQFVREALKALPEGEKSISAISLATGVHRQDVRAILSEKFVKNHLSSDLISRAVGMWLSKKPYCQKPGVPKALTYIGQDSELSKLAVSVSKELNHYSLMKELERTGTISFVDEKVELIKSLYVPIKDVARGADILELDLSELLNAIEANFSSEKQNLHLRTSFDNLAHEQMDTLRERIIEIGAEFHEKIRSELAKHDLDLSSVPGKGGGKITLTSFSWSETRDE